MFSFFKLSKVTRVNCEEPGNRLTWIKHGFSEFIGTIMLCILLAGLSIHVANGNELALYFISPIIISFYAGFIAIGMLLVIFLRWSCDLNPAVTTYRMLSGQNTYRYAFFKIAIQFTAAIIAGLIIYAFGAINMNNADNKGSVNTAISANFVGNQSFLSQAFGLKTGIVGGTFWIIAVELLATSILLFPIFTPLIKAKYRDFFILFIISLAVLIGVSAGTAALNPARGLAQQIPALFFHGNVGDTTFKDAGFATIGMEIGTLGAPFFLLTVQGFNEEYFNPWLTKMIRFRNFRLKNMRFHSSSKKDK